MSIVAFPPEVNDEEGWRREEGSVDNRAFAWLWLDRRTQEDRLALESEEGMKEPRVLLLLILAVGLIVGVEEKDEDGVSIGRLSDPTPPSRSYTLFW